MAGRNASNSLLCRALIRLRKAGLAQHDELRNQKFESIPLQRRICKLSVPLTLSPRARRSTGTRLPFAKPTKMGSGYMVAYLIPTAPLLGALRQRIGSPGGRRALFQAGMVCHRRPRGSAWRRHSSRSHKAPWGVARPLTWSRRLLDGLRPDRVAPIGSSSSQTSVGIGRRCYVIAIFLADEPNLF